MEQDQVVQALRELAQGVPGLWERLVEQYVMSSVVQAAAALLLSTALLVIARKLWRRGEEDNAFRDAAAMVSVFAAVAFIAAAVCISQAVSPEFQVMKELLPGGGRGVGREKKHGGR